MASIIGRIAAGALLTATGVQAPAQTKAQTPARIPAQQWQNLDAVDAAVVAGIGTGGTPRPVDRRIKLTACPHAVGVGAVIGGSVTVACTALGWRIRVPVTVNAPTPATPILMRKGDPVSVVTGSAGFTASVSGIADGEGRLGDRVRVRTGPGSAAVVGLVADPGTVRIY